MAHRGMPSKRKRLGVLTAHQGAVASPKRQHLDVTLGWPIPTRLELVAAISDVVASTLLPDLVRLIEQYVIITDLLYVLRRAPEKGIRHESDYIQSRSRRPTEIVCFDETTLNDVSSTNPLWRVSVDGKIDCDDVVAAATVDGHAVFLLDPYTSHFLSVDVRTRTVQTLPMAPVVSIQCPSIAANGDWVWVSGGTDHGAWLRSLVAFDVKLREWVDVYSSLPEPLTGHTLSPLPPLYKRSRFTRPPLVRDDREIKSDGKDGGITDDFSAAAILTGGEVGDEDDETVPSRIVSDCYLMMWSPSQKCARWAKLPALLEPRVYHSAAIFDGRLVVAGGSAASPIDDECRVPVDSAESLDLSFMTESTNTMVEPTTVKPDVKWVSMPSLPPLPKTIGGGTTWRCLVVARNRLLVSYTASNCLQESTSSQTMYEFVPEATFSTHWLHRPMCAITDTTAMPPCILSLPFCD